MGLVYPLSMSHKSRFGLFLSTLLTGFALFCLFSVTAQAARIGKQPASVKKPNIDFTGFVITGYRYTFNDTTLLRLGDSDGFYMRNARLKVTASVLHFRAVLTMDGSYDFGADSDDVSPSTRMMRFHLRDAYLDYRPSNGLRIRVGQMKIPFGYNYERAAAESHFAAFPLWLSGGDITFEYQSRAAYRRRDIGLSVGFEKQLNSMFGLSANAMVYNGNGENRFANDSDLPAVAARISAKIGPAGGWYLSVSGNVMYNPRVTGEQPALYQENDLIFGGDIRFEVAGFFVEAEGIYRTTDLATVGRQETSLGFHADIGYRIKSIGLEPVVRFDFYDPSSQLDDDELMYLTIGVNWYYTILGRHTVALRLSYTLKIENEKRTLNNDQVNLQLQYSF